MTSIDCLRYALHGSAAGSLARVLIFAAGVAMALPGGGDLGLSHLSLSLIALALAGVGALLAWTHRRRDVPTPARP